MTEHLWLLSFKKNGEDQPVSHYMIVDGTEYPPDIWSCDMFFGHFTSKEFPEAKTVPHNTLIPRSEFENLLSWTELYRRGAWH